MLSLNLLLPFPSAPPSRPLKRPPLSTPIRTQTPTHFLTHLPSKPPSPLLLLLPLRKPPALVPNATPGAPDDGKLSKSSLTSTEQGEEDGDGDGDGDNISDSDSPSNDEPEAPEDTEEPEIPEGNDDAAADEPEIPEGNDDADGDSEDDGTQDRSIKPTNQLKANPTLQLAVVFGLWYFQNVIFNIYNKKVLNLFPYPWLLASFQLLVGSIWMALLWATRLQPFPRISKRFVLALLGPALFHTIGHISACVSFSKVAVSFTHVIKSSEPAFTVLFSAFYGNFYPLHVWLSLIPIIAGCSLAAITEVSFNAQGLWGALISNVGFVMRNIYSKKSLYHFSHVNGLNLYGFISILSFFYLFPVAFFVEGAQWTEGFRRAVMAVPSPWTFYGWVMLSGVFYHLYNQSSYQALDKISPLTFSVGNTMKRVVVIVASVLVFRNPIRPLNALGSAIAVFGTFLYSQATAAEKSKKKDEIGEKKTS